VWPRVLPPGAFSVLVSGQDFAPSLARLRCRALSWLDGRGFAWHCDCARKAAPVTTRGWIVYG
jgi:hypothetical protein